jgi:hypothetical protein
MRHEVHESGFWFFRRLNFNHPAQGIQCEYLFEAQKRFQEDLASVAFLTFFIRNTVDKGQPAFFKGTALETLGLENHYYGLLVPILDKNVFIVHEMDEQLFLVPFRYHPHIVHQGSDVHGIQVNLVVVPVSVYADDGHEDDIEKRPGIQDFCDSGNFQETPFGSRLWVSFLDSLKPQILSVQS